MRTTHSKIMLAQGYIPASEAARKAQVHIATMYRWINEGKVVGTRVGSGRYVLRASLSKYLGPEVAGALGL